ncbi:MAG TPA: cytochrome C oxidase subunit IV family protein, partial [Pirellulales bacterium]|nr:cytochrome C oxidase subunit IV family protein [Pirellulales bacterium]
AILVALTLLTVGVSFIPLAGVWHVVLGMSIALIKGSLVVLVFMHAMHSPKITWLVIGAAVVWLMILLVLTLADYMTRGLIPHLPGH